MKLELSKCVVCNETGQRTQEYSTQELNGIMLSLLKDNGIDESQVSISDTGDMMLNGVPSLKLHSMMLKAEELGLQMKYTQKMQIEIY